MFTEEQKAKIEQYEVLKIQLQELKETTDELSSEILSFVEDDTSIKTKEGTLFTQKRTTYTFSDTHKVKKEELKELEKMEKVDGTAEEKVSRSLVYKRSRA